MTAWLIYSAEGAKLNQGYIELYIKEGSKLDIEVKLILVEDIEFGVDKHSLFLKQLGKKVKRPTFAICRTIYPLLSKHLELMGIRVFNNSFVAEVCNDKARTLQYLAGKGIPMVNTEFYQNYRLKEINRIREEASVIKAVEGHGGKQVFMLKPEDNRIDEGISSSDFIIQPFVGKNHQDLRVYVIGTKIVASVLRTARQGFKSNYSLGGQVELYQLNKQQTALVSKIIKHFEFGLVGIDFIIGENQELLLNEIEDVVGARMLYQCSDINIVEKYLNYILACVST